MSLYVLCTRSLEQGRDIITKRVPMLWRFYVSTFVFENFNKSNVSSSTTSRVWIMQVSTEIILMTMCWRYWC